MHTVSPQAHWLTGPGLLHFPNTEGLTVLRGPPRNPAAHRAKQSAVWAVGELPRRYASSQPPSQSVAAFLTERSVGQLARPTNQPPVSQSVSQSVEASHLTKDASTNKLLEHSYARARSNSHRICMPSLAPFLSQTHTHTQQANWWLCQSKACVRSMNATYKGWCCSLHFS